MAENEILLFQSRRAIEDWALEAGLEGETGGAAVPVPGLEAQPFPMQLQEDKPMLENRPKTNDLEPASALPCIKIVVLGGERKVGKSSLISRFLGRDDGEDNADEGEEQEWRHSPSASSASTLLPSTFVPSALESNSRTADHTGTISSTTNTNATNLDLPLDAAFAARNYYKTIIQVRPGVSVNAHIMDDQREESDEGNSLSTSSIFPSTTRGAMVVYDVSNRASFDKLAFVISEYRKVSPLGMQAGVLIVGNKCDLPAHKRQVSRRQGQDLAIQLGCMFYECSSLSSDDACNVDLAFISLFSALYNGLPLRPPRSPCVSVGVDDDDEDDEFEDVRLDNLFHLNDSNASIERVVNQLEDLELLPSTKNKKRSASSSLVKESFFDKTLDMLDWLIPSSPSDNEFSGDERDSTSHSKRNNNINPVNANITSNKRRRMKFSNKQLVDSLQPLPPPRTTSLKQRFKGRLSPTLISSIPSYSLNHNSVDFPSPFFAFSKVDLGIDPAMDQLGHKNNFI